MLIDGGGPLGPYRGEFDYGEDVVSPYLWSRGLDRLDVVVLTHAHGDHLSGLPRIIQNLRQEGKLPTYLHETLPPAQQAQPQDAPANKTVTAEQAYDANVQLMRQDLRSKRKQLVAANLPLTDTEVTKFWPLYDKYIAETGRKSDLLIGRKILPRKAQQRVFVPRALDSGDRLPVQRA